MKKLLHVWTLLTTTAMMLVGCNESDIATDIIIPKTPKVVVDVVGTWYMDASNPTWTYGRTIQVLEFQNDGKGNNDVYYTAEDEAVGVERFPFTYTITDEGLLTMNMPGDDAITVQCSVANNVLTMAMGNNEMRYQLADLSMIQKMGAWNEDKDLIIVPKAADYTIMVYGTSGGDMDNIIEEDFWEQTKDLLKDHNKVRVICMYKYGKDKVDEKGQHSYTGKYAEPGDIVWFELNNETDLNKIKESGMQADGLGEEAKALELCDPDNLMAFLELSKLYCPAKNYGLVIWGHGAGFSPMNDVPGKYSTTRGVLSDEWLDDVQLTMYDLHDAIKETGTKLNMLFFHNCLMGNMETLTEVKDCAEYIVASSHVLTGGTLLKEFVQGMIEKGNEEEAIKQMFERSTTDWQSDYYENGVGISNGDLKLIRSAKLDDIIAETKKLADKLITLYPTQKEAIDKATGQVYRYNKYVNPVTYPFFDLANYAQLLAKETGDEDLKAISKALDDVFQAAFVDYRDIYAYTQGLENYTLSICLTDKNVYTQDTKATYPDKHYLFNFSEGYEMSTFHQLTGWGNWLRLNEQTLESNPQNGF